jgi:hypothetical protein
MKKQNARNKFRAKKRMMTWEIRTAMSYYQHLYELYQGLKIKANRILAPDVAFVAFLAIYTATLSLNPHHDLEKDTFWFIAGFGILGIVIWTATIALKHYYITPRIEEYRAKFTESWHLLGTVFAQEENLSKIEHPPIPEMPNKLWEKFKKENEPNLPLNR